jgi:hypothetical protein
MIATTEDVMDGFALLWAASGLSAAVTGGLHGRGLPAGTPLPFALLRVTPGTPGTNSHGSRTYLEAFVLTVWLHAVWDDARRLAAMALLPGLSLAKGVWPATAGRLLHMRPLPPPSDPSPAADALARDVAVTPLAWEVLIQQTPAALPVG